MLVATGLITRRGPLLAGRRSFDLTEQTDSGFITTTIYLSDSQLGTTDLNEGDGIEIFGFTNKEGKSVVYLAERKEIAFSMKDVIADYKQRCKTYEYKTLLGIHILCPRKDGAVYWESHSSDGIRKLRSPSGQRNKE